MRDDFIGDVLLIALATIAVFLYLLATGLSGVSAYSNVYTFREIAKRQDILANWQDGGRRN
jgi:hypothetical protein